MPYSVKQNDPRCPAGKPWAVVNGDDNSLKGCHATQQDARDQQSALYVNVPDAAAAGPAAVQVPPLVTIPGVELVAAGTWALSTGEATFTGDDLAAAVQACQCPAVGDPIIKLGHGDARFNGDGEPAVGRVRNMGLTANGTKITGDLAGMPGWLAAISGSAYPQRSIEGAWDFKCQIGHTHPFVITAVSLLGETPPGVGTIASLADIAALYGIAAAADGTGKAWHLDVEGADMGEVPVLAAAATVEDVRRAFYDKAPLTQWITELQLNPPQLIVCDDADAKVYRVPLSIKGSAVSFGDPVEVQVEYVDAPAAASSGGGVRWLSPAASRSAAEPPPPAGPAPEPPPEPVEAAPVHAAMTGTHSHPHGANGSQGGDQSHDHAHTHAADNNHDHAHGAAQDRKGPRKVDFTDEQMAALRASLGLAEDDELTPDDLLTRVGKLSEAAASKQVAASGKLPDGVVAVDKDVLEDLRRQARSGVEALSRIRNAEREDVLAAAVRAGKFPVSRLDLYRRMWDASPENARQVIASMAKGQVPVEDIGQAGGEDELLEDEYKRLFPPAREDTGQKA